MMTEIDDWPFEDRRNVAVFTSKRIVSGEDWIYYVTHDADDGAWQFHPRSGLTPENEASIVGLGTIVDLDGTVKELADLPMGWHAWRDAQGKEWLREEMK